MSVNKQESSIRLAPYRARFTLAGVRKHVGYFKTRDEAERALENAEFAATYVVLGDDVDLDLKIINDQLEAHLAG